MNEPEATSFLTWYNAVPVRYRVLCAGNHDTSIEAHLINPRHYSDIIYLEHEAKEIEGIKIFGSPFTKAFGQGWAFNIKESRLDECWKNIPEGMDIVVTHGPPKGILDLSDDMLGNLEYCGDKALLNHINRVNPQFHIFGHIHENGENINKGTRVIPGIPTTFINASCVTDRKFSWGLTSRGIRFEI